LSPSLSANAVDRLVPNLESIIGGKTVKLRIISAAIHGKLNVLNVFKIVFIT
jgi:hypothetical protein